MKFMVKNKKFFCIVYHIEFFFKFKKRFLGKVYISATNNKKNVNVANTKVKFYDDSNIFVSSHS